MRCLKNLDAWSGGGWGVFIAPTTKPVVGEAVCRWAHRTVRCASHVTQLLGFWWFRPLELWQLGAPDSPMPHRTATVHCPVRLLSLLWLYTNYPCIVHVCRWPLESTVVLHSRCSAGTPDSPVTPQIVRWIIVERLSRNPKVKSSTCTDPGASDTVRWCTGHCPVTHRTVWCARPGFSSISFPPFFWTLTLIFLLVCVEPLAPVEYII
jgi:hypothetical protein